MGLDMYLEAEKYVSGWSHSRDPVFDAMVKMTGVTPDESAPSFTVRATVGYWRKANAIHAWFVKYVQGGKDECQRSRVKPEQLQELRAACQQVIDSVETVDGPISEGSSHTAGSTTYHYRRGAVVAQPGIAARVLPTQGGFFFGKTDYDEDYLADLRDTIRIIDNTTTNPAIKDCDFSYRASW